MKMSRKAICGVVICVLTLITLLSVIIQKNTKTENSHLDVERLRAMQYTPLTEEGQNVENCDYVKFGSFFTMDLNNDGYAEKILGTCKQIGNTDTLYMYVNVKDDGYLKNGKITINASNFRYSMQMVKDSVLKYNYVSNDVKTIELNDVYAGTDKLIMGDISAVINSANDYTRVNTVTLTGIHVSDEGVETEITKTIDLTVDWYGTNYADFRAKTEDFDFSDYYEAYENFEGDNIDDLIKTLTPREMKFSFDFRDSYNKLIPERFVVDIDVPKFKNVAPVSVRCDLGEYNNETGKIHIEQETTSTYNNINVFVTYPVELFFDLALNGTSISANATGYYISKNNTNEGFENPLKSNIASGKATVRMYAEIGEGDHIDKQWIGENETSGYMFNIQQILDAYEDEEIESDSYIVTCYTECPKDCAQIHNYGIKDYGDGDKWDEISISEYAPNVGIGFENIEYIDKDGWIDIYNDDTNEKVKRFTYSEIMKYTKNNMYKFENPIPHVKIITSDRKDINEKKIMKYYLERKIDIRAIVNNYEKTVIDNLNTFFVNRAYGTCTESNVNETYYFTYTGTMTKNRSLATVGISNDIFSTQNSDPVERTISISVPSERYGYYPSWNTGTFLVEIPSYFSFIDVENIECSNSNVKIAGSEVSKIANKYFIKVITTGEDVSGFKINIKAKMLVNPLQLGGTDKLGLYFENSKLKKYDRSILDKYDINGNGDIEDRVGYSNCNITVSAPSSFGTLQTVSNYNGDEITISPNTAEIKNTVKQATINVQFMNSYKDTVENIKILGKVPTQGNSYINGKLLKSEFSAVMKNTGISVPEELKDIATIYYSTVENVTNEIDKADNKWVLAENVENFDNIKSYLICLGDYVAQNGKVYTFSYDVTIPDNVVYNQVSYSCHAVYYDLNTANGKLSLVVQPRKVGMRIARYYDILLDKIKENTNLKVAGATYQLTEFFENVDEEDIIKNRIAMSSSEGKINFKNLRANQIYVFKEISAPEKYEINNKEIKFVVEENENKELQINVLSQDNFESEVKFEVDQDGKDVLVTKISNQPKYKLKINKKDKETQEFIEGVLFSCNNKRYKTKANQPIIIEGLSLDKNYKLKEEYVEGYYKLEDIDFKVEKSNDTLNLLSNCNEIANVNITNDESEDYIVVEFDLYNEKVPKYNLKIKKVDANEEAIVLKNAKFFITRADNGIIEEYITDENGIINVSDLYQFVEGKNATGKVVVEEVQAPDGYVLIGDKMEFYVTKGEDNKLVVKYYDNNSQKYIEMKDSDENNVEIVIKNNALFKITKKDFETGELLANVDFIIYEIDKETGNIVDFAKNPSGEYVGNRNENGAYVVTTNENGVVSVPLRNGLYKMIEVGYPEGYVEIGKTQIFSIMANQLQEEVDTLEINNIEDLVYLAQTVNSGNAKTGIKVVLKRTLDFNEDSSYKNSETTVYGDVNKDGKVEGLKIELTTGKGFPSIGQMMPFKGTFDGKNNEIRNLFIDSVDKNAGLFMWVGDSTIKNLVVKGRVKGTATENVTEINIGGIIAKANNTNIYNCGFEGTIEGDILKCNNFTGGIVGYHKEGEIKNCYTKGEIKIEAPLMENRTDMFVGGIGGYLSSIYGSVSKINNCFNTANISVNSLYGEVGGISGACGEISNSYNIGDIETIIDFKGSVGPIASYVSTINNSYFLDTVMSEGYNTEGISKSEEEMKIDDFVLLLGIENWLKDENNKNAGYPILKSIEIYNDEKNIETISSIEDLVELSYQVNNGNNYNNRIIKLDKNLDFEDDNSYLDKDSIAYGDINGNGIVEGIKAELTNKINGCGFIPIGSRATPFKGEFNGNNCKIDNIYIKARVNSFRQGLFGYVVDSKIHNLSISGEMIVESDAYGPVGGIVGQAQGSQIYNCYNEVNIENNDTRNREPSGGIVGEAIQTIIYSCGNSGRIFGIRESGGIVGTGNIVSNCYNYGEVIATGGYAGGITGIGSCENCYNIGTVSDDNTGGRNYGGIAGSGSCKNCYNIGNIEVKSDVVDCGSISGSNTSVENCYYINACRETDGGTQVSEEHMKTEEFIEELGATDWAKDINNVNNGFPILNQESRFYKSIEINYIEDLVKLSMEANTCKPIVYNIVLNRNLDFNDDDSYRDVNDDSFGDINEDRTSEGIKVELTK